MTTELSPGNGRLNDGLGPLPTSAEDDAVVQARLSKTPDEAYERGYLDGAARERERCAMKLQVTRADVQLAAGELSTEEWRMCAAVLRWMQGRIRGPNAANNRIDPPQATQQDEPAVRRGNSG